MIILGIHTGHDASLSLMRDGKIVSAIAVERLSRRKKDDFISREVFDTFLKKLASVDTKSGFFTSLSSPNRVVLARA